MADRLKASYAKTLYNPATGWLAWWKSEDGELHDYATPVVNGLAIQYGLVEPAQGCEILARRWAKMDQVGFTRVDLGVPSMLVPVRRSDYLLPDGFLAAWAANTTDLLRAHGFNGLGAWSDTERMRAVPRPLVYTRVWNFMSSYGKQRGGTYQQPGYHFKSAGSRAPVSRFCYVPFVARYVMITETPNVTSRAMNSSKHVCDTSKPAVSQFERYPQNTLIVKRSFNPLR